MSDEEKCRGCGAPDDRCRRDGCKTCCFCKRELLREVASAPDLRQIIRVEWVGAGVSLIVDAPSMPRVVLCSGNASAVAVLEERALRLRETVQALLNGRGWR